MVVRLRQELHYQRLQQVTAVLNALIACIPVGGAIVTNVLSGGASILEEMDVCGLVEAVLGIGKEGFGVFVSYRLVDRVLQRSKVVLSVEWKNVPAETKVVEDAALNLGLTIDELREKLLIVAAPSEEVIIQGVDEDTSIQPAISLKMSPKVLHLYPWKSQVLVVLGRQRLGWAKQRRWIETKAC